MDLNAIREKTKSILANFIDEIGLDGEFYASACNCPMTWGRPKINACGEFVAPASERLQRILQSSNWDEKIKRRVDERGLILVNQRYKQQEVDRDLFVTVIHETIHSNRNLLLFDVTRDNRNENAYSFNNGKFEQNTSEYNYSYADASQEVLKGSIDTSEPTVDSYKSRSSEEIEDMEFAEGKRDSQMEKQQIVDEALVELISVLSYKLYRNKEKGISADIWEEIEGISDFYEGEDVGAMCKIILKHHDFELFNWMIDPITYSQGDIHYDFFRQYTKADQELVRELYESAGVEMENEEGISEVEEHNEIDINDVKKIATSQTAMEELHNSFQDIINAKKREDIENVR